MENVAIICKYGDLLVTFDKDTYDNLLPLTGWTVKTSEAGYKSVRATKQPYVGQRLSRIILGYTGELLVGHRNGNSLDMCKANLRLATYSQNQFNKAVSSTKKSGLPKGVYYNKKSKIYYAQIRFEGRRIHLGSYSSPEAAELAYIGASIAYHKAYSVHISRE